MRKLQLSTFALASFAATAAAQEAFPLPETATQTAATENTTPFDVPLRMTQTKITDRNTLMAQGLPMTANNWDMATFDPSSRYIFVPCENFGGGGGIFRYDTQTSTWIEIFIGNGNGVATRNPDPSTFDASTGETAANDPCSWTPWNTIVFGEETTGGRFFECTNPLDPTGPFNIVWHAGSIPSVRHEGMRFDSDGNLYIIDESNSGCIYKFVPTNVPGDLSAGQTFVLSIDAYAADPNAVPSRELQLAGQPADHPRRPGHVGARSPAPNGEVITPTEPLRLRHHDRPARPPRTRSSARRLAAPRTSTSGKLANGNDVIYAGADQREPRHLDRVDLGPARPRWCATTSTTTRSTSRPALTSTRRSRIPSPARAPDPDDNFDDPDNLTIGPNGAVYILEDEDPGDIWKAVDEDGDGVAEYMGIFVSLTVTGSEPTGMIFDPNDPYRFICNIQHPASGNDALWVFDSRPYDGSDLDLTMDSGINAVPFGGPGEFVRDVSPFDTITLRVDSPAASLYGNLYAIFIQPFDTAAGQPAFLPPLWLNPFAPSFALAGGLVGEYPIVLPYGPSSVAIATPPGLAGLSIITQTLVVSDSGALVLSDAHEIVFK